MSAQHCGVLPVELSVNPSDPIHPSKLAYIYHTVTVKLEVVNQTADGTAAQLAAQHWSGSSRQPAEQRSDIRTCTVRESNAVPAAPRAGRKLRSRCGCARPTRTPPAGPRAAARACVRGGPPRRRDARGMIKRKTWVGQTPTSPRAGLLLRCARMLLPTFPTSAPTRETLKVGSLVLKLRIVHLADEQVQNTRFSTTGTRNS